MVNACLEINTTRDIAHQIVRHLSFAFQEFSPNAMLIPRDGRHVCGPEARLQDEKNRQNSIETDDNVPSDKWEEMQQDVMYAAGKAYKWAIDNGIAKEQVLQFWLLKD